jgi:hypothetical protein
MVQGFGDPRHIVDDPSEITPGYLSAALRDGGVDANVKSLRYERIGTGQMGACYRFSMEHEGAGPDSLVLKIGAGPRESRGMIGQGYAKEIGFYTRLAQTARISTPHAWRAAVDDECLSFTLLLEDAAPSRPGKQEAGCTIAQAQAALYNLAGLHAPFWNSAALEQEASWLARPKNTDLDRTRDLLIAGTEHFIKLYPDRLPAEDAETLRGAAKKVASWVRSTQDVFTVLHGDYRLDNLLFPHEGRGKLLAVDWQTIALGFPGRDVAYFIATALTPEQRRTHHEALIAAYHARLVEQGVKDYSLDACMRDFALGIMQGPLTGILGRYFAAGVQSEDSDRMFLSLARHSAVALRDHKTLELIPD